MTFQQLKTELFARGANYLEESGEDTARAERWINEAYREVAALQAWPWLNASVTGAVGAGFVSIPDLRRIRFVTDISGYSSGVPGRHLVRATEDELARDGVDQTTTGTPEVYYVQTGNSVRTYPLGGTIRVDYIKRLDPLVADQSPLFAEEYHGILVDRAMIKVYKDSDNFEAAAALKAEYDLTVAAMAEDYQVNSREVLYIEPTGDDS